MRISDLGRYALGVCAAAMFAGCGAGSTPLSPSPAGVMAERTHGRPAYSVLYSFKGGSGDGAVPYASLINANGTLYGTTQNGGLRCERIHGCGTVFAITTSGSETLLYGFKGRPDGVEPYAGLINVNGTLYGTTHSGGAKANRRGTVFKITTSGTETVLHSFGGTTDGSYPEAGLLNVSATLYGTTVSGGVNGYGTVFKITTSGTETVLYSFKGGSGDGEYPSAGLINVNDTLYGTTAGGGANKAGTVFEVTPSGTETVLYSFKGGSGDGENPLAGLINVNGTLYGTTAAGGPNCSASGGCGTVFSITLSGKETVLHSFGSSGDGLAPFAGLLNFKGTLYGTTVSGGAQKGTVFSITPSGVETVLHRFNGTDGLFPYAGLINVKGRLYGTTSGGGANNDGTVFSLLP
jgi:uncharacterized repeat protein (TIGR03803 family)